LSSLEQIAENLDIIIEKKAVFDKCVQLLESPEMRSTSVTLSSLEESGTGANFLAGTIKAEDELRMKRMIFRISRGRAIPTFFNFDSNDNLLLVKYYFNPSQLLLERYSQSFIKDLLRTFYNKN